MWYAKADNISKITIEVAEIIGVYNKIGNNNGI
jgi:hypothetical protein